MRLLCPLILILLSVVNRLRHQLPVSKSIASRLTVYTRLSYQIFNIAVTGIETKVEPDGIGNDIWRESMTLVGIHPPILSISASLFGSALQLIPTAKGSLLSTTTGGRSIVAGYFRCQ